jgi:3-oxoacyl-[acyl-carrier protein] reductase
MDLELEGSRALVCGGSAGLGRACAESLGQAGARLALAARAGERLSEAARRLAATPVPADLSTVDGPARAVEGAVAALGGLDLLVVNSGGPPAGAFTGVDDAAWETAIAGTLMSAIRLVRLALPTLAASDHAAVVLILSSSVRAPLPELVTSNVLRPGLAGLIKTLAAEIAPAVRINGVAPGKIETARVAQLDAGRAERSGSTPEEVRARSEASIPLGRYGEPRELGDTVAFLLSRRASYVHGQILLVDGGMSRSLP